MRDYILFEFRKIYRKYGLFGIMLLIISIISIFAGIYMSYIFISKVSTTVRIIENGERFDQQLTGVVGDFISGVIGTVWSFAGVILFFLALRLQSKELSLQLEEMKSTRNVFQVQQFENTFFNLLKTQNDIRQSTELRVENFNHIQGKTNTYFNGNAAFEKIRGFIDQEKEKLDKNFETIDF